jgi:hypothetical protein
MQQLLVLETRYFYVVHADVKSKGQNHLLGSFAREAVKSEPERVKLKNLQFEAVARERLKTQQAAKRLSVCCGDL